MAPAGKEGVTRVVASRFALFPQPERSEAEWGAWWSAYYDALEDLSEEALEGGMRAYLREPAAEFLPKPGKLRELARQATTATAKAAGLAARCASYTPPRAEATKAEIDQIRLREMPTETERDRVLKMAKDYAAQAAPPRPEYRWATPRTDEHGITPEMRAHLNRSSGE